MGRPKVGGGKQGRRPSEAKERFWRRHLTEQASGWLTIRDYCRKHSISEPSFYAWRRDIARRDQVRSRAILGSSKRSESVIRDTIDLPSPEFVRIDVQPALLGPAATIEIVLPGELRVLVPPGVTRDQLGEVLAALYAVSAKRTPAC